MNVRSDDYTSYGDTRGAHHVIVDLPAKGVKNFSVETANNTPSEVLAANENRISAVIQNSGEKSVFLGKDNTVTVANGFLLINGQQFKDTDSKDAWFAVTMPEETTEFRIIETVLETE